VTVTQALPIAYSVHFSYVVTSSVSKIITAAIKQGLSVIGVSAYKADTPTWETDVLYIAIGV
jgi:hypothetical protein